MTDDDIINDDAITKNEVDMIIPLISCKNNRILDLCCGFGRHTFELYRRGYTNIYGFDYSKFLISMAKNIASRKHINPFIFQIKDARYVNDKNKYDNIIILGNSFGLLGDKDNMQLLVSIYNNLKIGGSFIIDTTDANYIINNYQDRSWEWIKNGYMVCRQRELSKDKLYIDTREMIVDPRKGVIVDQIYREYLYSFDKIKNILEHLGFLNIHVINELLNNSNGDSGLMKARLMITGNK